MITHPRPLMEVCAAMPDFWKLRGKRHPLAAIFALACCAMLGGARRYSALAEWERNYGTRIAETLGFTHGTPCAATLHTILRHVNRDKFEAPLGTWANSVVGSLPAAPEVAMALDGKTPRGSKKQGLQGHTSYRRWRTTWVSRWPNTLWTTKPMRSQSLRLSYSTWAWKVVLSRWTRF